MKRIILLTTLMVSACQLTSPTSESQTAELAASTQVSSTAVNSIQLDKLISPTGIGKAKLGMTLKNLKEISSQDTDFELIPSFAEDIDAVAVSQKGIVQYYILYNVENNSESDTESNTIVSLENRVITALMTNNKDYQTESGIEVGTLIKDAEEVYGNAVLAYNTEGESKEYIIFGNKNPDNLKFRASYFKLISDGLGFSGIYAEYPGVSYTTDKYRDDAAIAEIEVACDLDDCIR